jgi:hypothetical protein
LGGWTPFRALDAESKAVFTAATKGLMGVKYTPKEVATQVVNGTNYRFRCDAEVVLPDPQKYTVTMEIFQPINGVPMITGIIRTGWSSTGVEVVPGGWTRFGPLDKQSKAVFETAMKGFVGVGYTPLEVSTQVVAGTNYRFLCDAQVVYPDAPMYKALVTIYQPLKGVPQLVDIHKI